MSQIGKNLFELCEGSQPMPAQKFIDNHVTDAASYFKKGDANLLCHGHVLLSLAYYGDNILRQRLTPEDLQQLVNISNKLEKFARETMTRPVPPLGKPFLWMRERGLM